MISSLERKSFKFLKIRYFPKISKFFNVKPIPKKPKYQSLEEVKPVPLLSTFSKSFKIAVLKRLVEYFMVNTFSVPTTLVFKREGDFEDFLF